MPRIGTSGIAACTCQTARTAMGLMAGPERPPVIPASAGRIVSVSITTPSVVLIIDSASAPAAMTAPATSTMSVTSGESLASTGTVELVLRRTALITCAEAIGSQANTRPRLSTLGQEIFTSSAAIPGSWRSRLASAEYSSTVPPAIDTTAGMPRSRNQARSLAMNASTPGPCNPMELSIPEGVSAMRGVARPDRGFIMMLLVTTPPMAVRSKKGSSSRPAAAQPLAVNTGAAKRATPSEVEISTISVPLAVVRRRCPPARCPRQPSARGHRRRPAPPHRSAPCA